MCLAVSLFPFLNASVKYLSTDFAIPMLVWGRYVGHFAFMLIAFMPRHGINLFVTRNLKVQIWRSMLLLGSTTLYFTALGFIPLATAASVSFTAPFIVTALSVPLLGERVGWRRWAAVTVGFIGALIIIRPGSTTMHWAVFLVLGNSTCYALYQILTRKLAGHDHPATTITYTAIVGTLASSLVVPFFWQTLQHWLELLLFLTMGFVGGFGHYFVVKAFQYGEASVLAPLAYGQLIGATLLGYLVFGDFPDQWTWLGAAIIVACGLYIAYRERTTKIILANDTRK